MTCNSDIIRTLRFLQYALALSWPLLLAFGWFVWRCVIPRAKSAKKPLLIFFVAATLYGGAKHFATVTILNTDTDAVYLIDRGSFVTNDYVHVDFTTVVIPQTANLYIYRRQVDSTNDIDWTEHLATTIGEFSPPQDIQFPLATNFNWIVFSDWTPGPAVETNGVWYAYWGLDQQHHEKLIPIRTCVRIDNDIIATPGSKPYDAEVEWIESTGTQWINTELNTTNIYQYETYAAFLGSGAEGSNVSRHFFIGVSGNRYYAYLGDKKTSGPVIDYAFHQHTISKISKSFEVDNVIVFTYNNVTVNPAKFYLFAVFNTGGSASYFLKQKKSRSVFYDINMNIIRDFIPVRFTNERGETEGAMYDRISGQLFRNQGTGKFVIGPDKQ